MGSDPLNFADDEGLQRRAGGPATLNWGQAQLNFQGISLTNQIRQYQPNYSYSYASAPGQGFTAANIGQLQSTLQRLQSLPSCVGSSSTAFSTISPQVSQKQFRHIHERNEYRGGGYLSSLRDAQTVLDALHSGNAVLLGYSRQGFPIVRVESVIGTNVNLGAGIINQPTNVFMIKGTAHPSVVPMNPNWTPQ